MVQYRYLFADLLTNQIFAELPVTSVSFSKALNSAGSFSGHVLLTGLPVVSVAMNATIPGRSAIYVDRDGVLVWGGIIWSREYKSADQHLSFNAAEFESYFAHRLITADADFQNVDQLTVAQSLINTAQAATNGNIGVTVPTNTSGQTVNRTFYGYELKSVLSAFQDLAKAGIGNTGQTGFDFSIDVAYSPENVPLKSLNLGYPRLGTAYSATSTTAPVFEFPDGNVKEYSYPEDGSIVANKFYATGAGSNEGKIIYQATDTTKLTYGWPVLEGTASYSDVDDPSLINNLAIGSVAALSYPPTVLSIVTSPNVDPVLGSFRIGDDARVRILDDRFPNGLDAIYRITALTVSPGETGPERMTVTLTIPTAVAV